MVIYAEQRGPGRRKTGASVKYKDTEDDDIQAQRHKQLKYMNQEVTGGAARVEIFHGVNARFGHGFCRAKVLEEREANVPRSPSPFPYCGKPAKKVSIAWKTAFEPPDLRPIQIVLWKNMGCGYIQTGVLMMNMHEKLVVVAGAGFFGSVLAERIASQWGWRVLLLDKRGHIGGNSWSCADRETGVEEHVYGPHIFHTSKERVWTYINEFASFNDYRHTVWATRKGRVYPLPFGLAAINLLLGTHLSPSAARAWVETEAAKEGIGNPQNLEEKALSLVGRPLYEAFVKEYTEKHWGRKATELPAYIISRLPVRYTYNTGYYNDRWQGIPIGGYGKLFERMLRHPNIDVRLNCDYLTEKNQLPPCAFTIYTGAIDQFFDYQFGALGWRSVRFEKEIPAVQDFQGTSVMNECDGEVPYTRTHEFKHFTPELAFDKTVIYREFSFAPTRKDDAYYPIRTDADKALLAQYQQEAASRFPSVYFGGRLGAYAYLDMDQSIAEALALFDSLSERYAPR